MSDSTPYDDGRGKGLGRAFATMPKWKVGLLVVSLIVGAVGLGGYAAARSHNQGKTVTVQQTVPAHPGGSGSALPGGSSGFVGGGGGQPAGTDTVTTTTTVPAPPSITEQYTPYVAKMGFSFFVGLIAGTISRTFLKLAALLAGLIVACIAALHYFNVNVDLSGVQGQTQQATTWLHGQLDQLWAAVKTHLPSAGSATAGFLFGMKRR